MVSLQGNVANLILFVKTEVKSNRNSIIIYICIYILLLLISGKLMCNSSRKCLSLLILKLRTEEITMKAVTDLKGHLRCPATACSVEPVVVNRHHCGGGEYVVSVPTLWQHGQSAIIIFLSRLFFHLG